MNKLHSRNYLAFAERVQSEFDEMDALLDTGLSPALLAPTSSPGAVRFRDCAAEMDAGLRFLANLGVRDELGSFVPDELLSGPEGAACVERQTDRWLSVYRLRRTAAKQRKAQRSGGRRLQGYRDSATLRRAKIVVGTHMALGTEVSLSTLAKHLGRGTPTGQRSGITDDNIRHAWGTVGMWLYRVIIANGAGDLPKAELVCMALILESEVLRAIYNRAVDHFGRANVSADRVDELVATGLLWTWRLDPGADCRAVSEAQGENVAFLTKSALAALKNRQRYLRQKAA